MTTLATETVTQRLGRFAAETPLELIPEAVLVHSRRAILDFFGVAIGGADSEPARLARSLASTLGGHQQASVLVTGERTSTANAALVNGLMANVMDFDDTHVPTILHPTSPIMGAALAVGEWRHSTGQALLAAHVLAYEISARVSLAISPESYNAGWHLTGTTGTIGAAVAAGRLLGLDVAGMQRAIGLAATQAAGQRQQFGEMAKSLHAGRAASNGVAAALLAAEGFGASPASLEGTWGLASLMSAQPRPDEMIVELGQRWELPRNGLKPYACGIVAHPAIDVARALAQSLQADAADIERIDLRVHPLALTLTGRPNPATGIEAKFSLFFACAAQLMEGAAGKAQFTDAVVNRPDIRTFMARISAVQDSSLTPIEAAGNLRLRDGRSASAHVAAARGTPGNPLTDGDLAEKVRQLAVPVLGVARSEALIATVHALEGVDDIAQLARATVPAS
ncbi:MAG TPA: MmgE/PrpD family protein [Chloroflexota bacterium]|nr:MmgE/PrpD family protein [Chloroflexota bacterium]